MIRLLALVLALAGAVAAGCGSDDQDSLAALDVAAEKTKDVESFQMDFTADVDAGGESLSMKGNGTSNAESTRGRIEMELDAGEESFDAEAILADETMFIHYRSGVQLPDGKRWLRMQDEELGLSTLTPSEFVEFLRESDRIEVAGTEEIRGEETTHFRGPLNMKELAERTGDEAVEQFKQIPGAEDADFDISIWIDGEGLPARMALDGSFEGGTLKMGLEILEYDVPLNADPPPQEQVAELSDLGG